MSGYDARTVATCEVTFDPDTELVHVEVANNDYTGSVADAIESFTTFVGLITNRDTIRAVNDLLSELKQLRDDLEAR